MFFSPPSNREFLITSLIATLVAANALAVVLRIPLLAAYLPQVRPHGLLAAGSVFLRQECILIGRDLREVALAGLDHRGNRCEALASLQLVAGRLGRAVVSIGLADIDSRTLAALGRRGTVRADEVVTMFVTVQLFGLRQSALDVLDTRGISDFSHLNSGVDNPYAERGKKVKV